MSYVVLSLISTFELILPFKAFSTIPLKLNSKAVEREVLIYSDDVDAVKYFIFLFTERSKTLHTL